jgi:hypothetical protein
MGGNSEKRRLNEIILTEEMNQLHRNRILLMFNITYVLQRFAVRNDLLHWLCISELVLGQHVLLSVCSHECSDDSSTIYDVPYPHK